MKKYGHYIDARGEGFISNSTQKQRQLLRPLNNLERRILQKQRKPTYLACSEMALVIKHYIVNLRFFFKQTVFKTVHVF